MVTIAVIYHISIPGTFQLTLFPLSPLTLIGTLCDRLVLLLGLFCKGGNYSREIQLIVYGHRGLIG